MNFIFGMITGILITILTIIITALIMHSKDVKARNKATDALLEALNNILTSNSEDEETDDTANLETSSDEKTVKEESNE